MKVGLLAGIVFAGLSTIIGQAAAEIVAIVAALTALGWLWKKMILPAAQVFQRTHQAVGALEDLGAFMTDTAAAVQRAELAAQSAAMKADHLDLRLDLMERHIGLYASEDAARVRAAMHPDAPDVPAS
jgi:hypothetical protein